jgi:hypothetical protein
MEDLHPTHNRFYGNNIRMEAGNNMAIVPLIVGLVIFLIGIGGQVMVGRRFAKTSSAGDRRSVRIVLLLAALIIGAWLVIASGVHLLHSHAATHAASSDSAS